MKTFRLFILIIVILAGYAGTTAQAAFSPKKSLVDLLKADGKDSSKEGRAALAKELSVAEYDFSANKNAALKKKYEASKTQAQLVPWMDSKGMVSTKEARRALAKELGVANYDFSKEKNAALLSALQKGPEKKEVAVVAVAAVTVAEEIPMTVLATTLEPEPDFNLNPIIEMPTEKEASKEDVLAKMEAIKKEADALKKEELERKARQEAEAQAKEVEEKENLSKETKEVQVSQPEKMMRDTPPIVPPSKRPLQGRKETSIPKSLSYAAVPVLLFSAVLFWFWFIRKKRPALVPPQKEEEPPTSEVPPPLEGAFRKTAMEFVLRGNLIWLDRLGELSDEEREYLITNAGKHPEHEEKVLAAIQQN